MKRHGIGFMHIITTVRGNKMQVQVKFDSKVVMKSLVVLLICFMPITYIHEIGHQIPCKLEGFEPITTILPFGASTACIGGELQNPEFYYAFGGTLSTLVVMLPMIRWKWIMEKRYPAIAMFTFAAGEGTTAIIESVLHEFYVNNIMMWSNVMGIVYVLMFTVFAIWLGRHK